MQVTRVGAVLIVLSGVCAQAPQTLHVAVEDALRWYFHWRQQPPAQATMECRGARFDGDYFAYCQPGRLTIELATDGTKDRPEARFIGHSPDDYEKALNWFSKRKGREGRQSFQFSLRSDDIASYQVDQSRSKIWMEAVGSLVDKFANRLATEGHQVKVMFPLVSRNDAFYHVYVTEGGRVNWIWEFVVHDGKISDHINWIYDQPHHNIPRLAQSFSEDPKRWYRVVGE